MDLDCYMFTEIAGICLQDLVGDGNDWDLILVDHDPFHGRAVSVDRLLSRARLVIIHDTENYLASEGPVNCPADFM